MMYWFLTEGTNMNVNAFAGADVGAAFDGS